MDWKNIIKQAQAKNSLTQTELAQMADCSQSCIADLARGRTLEPRYSLGLRLLELSKGSTTSRQHLARKPRTPKPQTPATAGEASHA